MHTYDMKVTSEELESALKWFRSSQITSEQREAVKKAMRSVGHFTDSTCVLIATYRMYTRMMADTVPLRR